MRIEVCILTSFGFDPEARRVYAWDCSMEERTMSFEELERMRCRA